MGLSEIPGFWRQSPKWGQMQRIGNTQHNYNDVVRIAVVFIDLQPGSINHN